MGATQDHLAQAVRDLAAARDRVEQQQRVIATLQAHGHDTTTAESLLETMLQTVRTMEDHRRVILKELGLAD